MRATYHVHLGRTLTIIGATSTNSYFDPAGIEMSLWELCAYGECSCRVDLGTRRCRWYQLDTHRHTVLRHICSTQQSTMSILDAGTMVEYRVVCGRVLAWIVVVFELSGNSITSTSCRHPDISGFVGLLGIRCRLSCIGLVAISGRI